MVFESCCSQIDSATIVVLQPGSGVVVDSYADSEASCLPYRQRSVHFETSDSSSLKSCAQFATSTTSSIVSNLLDVIRPPMS